MTTPDPLQCSFEDARRVNLRQGMALSTAAKIAFFEEMVSFAAKFGARDRLAGRRPRAPEAASMLGAATKLSGMVGDSSRR